MVARKKRRGVAVHNRDRDDFSKEDMKSEKAAVVIQKNIRGFFARKKYRINHLARNQQTNYLTFVVGNDPFMPEELGRYNEPDKKIALIATSGLRAVSLACKLGNKNNTPKIILIDNSAEVYEFWYKIREFVKKPVDGQTVDEASNLFLKNLPTFLNENKSLYRELPDDACVNENSEVKYLNQNINIYFSALIKKYGYEYVQSVIAHTSLIKQSWANADVFAKVKNILAYHKIDNVFMYPSNILDCIDDVHVQNEILENIAKINPTLTIYSDRCRVHGYPEKIFLMENSRPDVVRKTIFLPTTCEDKEVQLSDLSILYYLLLNLKDKEDNLNSFGNKCN